MVANDRHGLQIVQSDFFEIFDVIRLRWSNCMVVYKNVLQTDDER